MVMRNADCKLTRTALYLFKLPSPRREKGRGMRGTPFTLRNSLFIDARVLNFV